PRLPFAGNAAAIVSVIESVARLRAELARRIGAERTELALDLASSLFSALAQRPLTSFVDGLHKWSTLKERQATRETCARLEPKLAASLTNGVVGAFEAAERPTELPAGPIEEYGDRAWIVSLAGFAVSFATSRSLQRAVAALYGSLPRPAHLGRDVF